MRDSQFAITVNEVSPARKPGTSTTGAPSPRGTPAPYQTGDTSSRASSACQRVSARWWPHQRSSWRAGRPVGANEEPVTDTGSGTSGTGRSWVSRLSTRPSGTRDVSGGCGEVTRRA